MGYRIKGAFRRGNAKKVFTVFIILWIALSIVLIAPISVNIVKSTENGIFNFNEFLDKMLTNPMGSGIGEAFKPDYIGTFAKGELYLTIVLAIFATYGFLKSAPKHEYSDIEHGSSDWADGEQYEVLSPKKGIILAEKHYLPVDKRGNVNVLVVGRFRFW